MLREGEGQEDDVGLQRLARGEERMEVACEGPLVLNSEPPIYAAALGGADVAEEQAAVDVAAGRLVRVLDNWRPPVFGFYLFPPSSRLPSAGLRVLIDHLAAEVDGSAPGSASRRRGDA